ncbi:MAG: nucleoside kinase [Clostridia bacterium]|nr:nucleoside kinase [Clostridia bacterium]
MTIKIIYDEDQSINVVNGATLLEIIDLIPARRRPPLAALVNGELQELDYPLYVDSQIRWVDANSSLGWLIYRRSLIYLLMLAVHELFPDYQPSVSHSLAEGCFCWAENKAGRRLEGRQIEALEQRMRAYVDADLAIQRVTISREDAAAFFAGQGKTDKARLLLRRDQLYLSLYRANGFSEYLFGRMVARAGVLQEFRLIPLEDGFILRLPAREYLGIIDEDMVPTRQLQASLREYNEWSDLLKLRTVSDLNAIVEAPGADFSDLVLIAETLQERTLHTVTDAIEQHFPRVKLLLLAGPSSSGKTTTARRLGIQFRSIGIRPLLISMDDYFVDAGKTPLTAEGKPDFEGIAALDLPRLQRDIADLLVGKETCLPAFDFCTGTSIPEHRRICMDEDQIIIVEGIHALNDIISEGIPAEQKRKIFVSALAQLNLDATTPVSSADNRLIRRIVRDAMTRNLTPADTLRLWDEVRRGEHHNIFPFQEQADFFINSALLYELPVLRPLIESKLASIGPDEDCYLEAQRILRLISYFSPAPAELVPRTSVLQEFLGNSVFQ